MTNDALVPLTDLAEQINAEHQACEQAFRAGVQHAINAGNLLIQAREHCPHGTWLPWLAANFHGSERTAQAYMRVAREWPALEAANPQRVTELSYRDALKELAEPRQAKPTPEYGGEIGAENDDEETPNPYRRWVETHDVLAVIYDLGLAREEYGTFRDYLRDRWSLNDDGIAEVERCMTNRGVRYFALILAEIYDLVPGITFLPTGLKIPAGYAPPIETWKRVTSLLGALPRHDGYFQASRKIL
jgi:hypothetical protein